MKTEDKKVVFNISLEDNEKICSLLNKLKDDNDNPLLIYLKSRYGYKYKSLIFGVQNILDSFVAEYNENVVVDNKHYKYLLETMIQIYELEKKKQK